jgi:hypothetical protein
MSYTEGSSYITAAEWSMFVGAAIIADITDGDHDVSLAYRNAASGVVDEYAVSAGLSVPLGAEHLTYAMKRRVAMVAAHMCASDRKPKYRNAQGRGPFHDQHDVSVIELAEWKAGVKTVPGDTESEREHTSFTTHPRRKWLR